MPRPPEIEPEITTVAGFKSSDVTPTDRAVPYTKVPNRGVRKRLLGDGDGDFCIYAISEGEHGIPPGALLPVADVPRFVNAKLAKAWLKNLSGDLLANRQILIFRAVELINVTVVSHTKVELIEKTKLIIKANGQEGVDE